MNSVTYVSTLSLWALVSGHWSAWQAARVEVNQEKEAKRQARHNVPAEVVAKIVEETEISATKKAKERKISGGSTR